MNRIIGGDFGSVKFHKKDKVLSLKAVNSSVKIDNDVVILVYMGASSRNGPPSARGAFFA